ncbi:MAG: class I SAM-dependent methyltransferase [Candidatus Omnitrophota bacterium]
MICEHKSREEYSTFGSVALSRCSGCGLVFVDTKAKAHEPAALYEQYYKNETGGRFNFGVEYVIRMFRFFRALKIFSIFPAAKSILDIGSGRGFMLYYLKKFYGYNTVVGIQPSKPALDFSKNKLGLEVYGQDFLGLDFDGRKFDIISMWHVLEHVAEPERYIEKISRYLNSQGRLVIEVPNLDSWTARWTGSYWMGLDLKYHLYFFSPATLISLLKKYGFKIKTVHTFSLEYSIFISTSSIVSRLTHTDHLLFEWLQTGRSRPSLLLHIVLFMLLFPVCFLINILFFFSKRGEVLLIVSEKGL